MTVFAQGHRTQVTSGSLELSIRQETDADVGRTKCEDRTAGARTTVHSQEVTEQKILEWDGRNTVSIHILKGWEDQSIILTPTTMNDFSRFME